MKNHTINRHTCSSRALSEVHLILNYLLLCLPRAFLRFISDISAFWSKSFSPCASKSTERDPNTSSFLASILDALLLRPAHQHSPHFSSVKWNTVNVHLSMVFNQLLLTAEFQCIFPFQRKHSIHFYGWIGQYS